MSCVEMVSRVYLAYVSFPLRLCCLPLSWNFSVGASVVGGEELIKKILEDKNLAADRAFATPDMMPLVGRVARILGPRGLMPNPKLGTMTKDVGEAGEIENRLSLFQERHHTR